MKKALLLYTIVIGFGLVQSGCTSKKVDQDGLDISELSGEETLNDEIGDVASSDGAIEGGTEGDDVGEDFAEGEDFGEGEGLEEGQELATDDLDGLEAAPDVADDQSLDGLGEEQTDLALGDESDNAESIPDAQSNSMGLSDDSSYSDSGTSDPLADSSDSTAYTNELAEPVNKVIPLQKMYPEPYKSYGKAINAMYVAREGDTIESVSRKIYGDDRSEEMKKVNPTFARREMKVGDKVYYNSPQRIDDMTTMQTYYEDMGLAPEVYLSQPGDNIRKVSKNLLGHENSWKEIWATNPDVESKWDLPEGTRLRYWPSTSSAPIMANMDDQGAAMGNMADNSMDAPPPMGEEPPPLPEDVADAPTSSATVETAPPVEVVPEPVAPPPPPVAVAPPPPPPRPAQNPAVPSAGTSIGDDPDQLMALGAGAILLLAVIFMFIIIKKKRARKNDIDFQTATHTHID